MNLSLKKKGKKKRSSTIGDSIFDINVRHTHAPCERKEREGGKTDNRFTFIF